MAELFKPDVGNLGGSNVSVYTPPTPDYSGIFNSVAKAFDGFEKEKVTAPKLSEAEEKNIVLEPYITKVQRIMSADDIPEVKKYAMVNGIRTEVARKYPAYNDVFEKATTSSITLLDPDGDPVQKEYEAMSKFAETEIGAFARAQAFSSAIDKDGNFDQEMYESTFRSAYTQNLALNSSLAEQKRRNELYKEDAPERFRTDFAPKAIADISKSIETFTTGQGLKAMMEVVKSGGAFEAASPEAAQSVMIADQIATHIKFWDTELTKRKVQAGYNPNDPQFSNEPLLLELKSLEGAFRNAGTSMNALMKSNNEALKEKTFSQMAPLAKEFIIKAGFFPPGASDLFVAEGLANPAIRDAIKVSTIGVDPRVSTQGSGTSVPTALPTSGVSVQDLQKALPEHNPKVVEILHGTNTEDKKDILKAASIYIDKADLSNTDSVTVVNNYLDGAYGLISMRYSGAAEVGVTPLEQTKIYFGPKAINLISEIQKKNPVYGESLYKVVNKAIMTETMRHMAYLSSSFNKNFPNNPIMLEFNNKGLIEIKIDPRAKKEDPVFMQLIDLGYETDEDLLDNLQNVTAMPYWFAKGLRQSVESINTYLMASAKFPDDLKNSPDYAPLFIREQLENLPKYGGASVLLEELGK